MKRSGAITALIFTASLAQAAVPVFPLKDIRAGMHATGLHRLQRR